MAKGGNNRRNNGSKFTKPYDVSNSFVKKVALRVCDYIGGFFGSPTKSDDPAPTDSTHFTRSDDAPFIQPDYDIHEFGQSTGIRRCYDTLEGAETQAKRIKLGSKRKFISDLPISPIATTSSLVQSSVSHSYDIETGEDFTSSVAGPSGLQNDTYAKSNPLLTLSSSNTNLKANGAADNHSDSSESTSGCSSLVPQSDRLSQTAFVSSSRKKILEEKLQYARQLKQNRASMLLNRSIPVVSESAGSRKKPSFDVSIYGPPIFEKSSVREKMVNSPFYTGQTSYGGASAYRRPRTSLYSQLSGKGTFDRRDGLQVEVKPSHHGSTEDLSSMSHTAKRILEALEQYSTPISDAKRIPVRVESPPLGRQRKRGYDSLNSSLSTKKSVNPTKGPLISGLSIPTLPDLLKLKRLEKIQDSTAAARQVAVQKQEYSLPTPTQPSKHTGKIVTKIKDKQKEIDFERPPEVNLPKVQLPITTLPKFDFKLPPAATQTTDSAAISSKPEVASKSDAGSAKENDRTFKFSPPIYLSSPENVDKSVRKNNFTFNTPIKAISNKDKYENGVLSNVSNFMSPKALAKLKSNPVNEKMPNAFGIQPAKELKPGSVMDLLRKTLENSKKSETESSTKPKSQDDTWECSDCFLRNLNDSKYCSGCKTQKVAPPSNANTNANMNSNVPPPSASSGNNVECKPAVVTSGFGNKFKPPSGSWSCKECFVNNNASATKCIACESPKPESNATKETVAQVKPPLVTSGFGDLFKKKAGQWECSVCLIQNKESDSKCAACESPKPGAAVEKPNPPKFNFGLNTEANGFKFGIDKADIKNDAKTSEAMFRVTTTTTTTATTLEANENGSRGSESTFKPLSSVTTSYGVFNFGISPSSVQPKNTDSLSHTKSDSSKTVESKTKISTFSFTQSSTCRDETDVNAAGKTLFPNAELGLKNKDDRGKDMPNATDMKSNELSKSSESEPGKENSVMKPFSFDSQNKTSAAGLFTFGSPITTEKDKTLGGSISTGEVVTFGSGLKVPDSAPTPATGFTFGLSNPITAQNTVKDNADSNKFTLFQKNDSNGKVELPASTPGIAAFGGATKPIEKAAEVPATPQPSVQPSTNSIFGSTPIFKDSKMKMSPGNEGGNNNTAATSFSTATSIFGSGQNVLNGSIAQTNSFGCPTSTVATGFAPSVTPAFAKASEEGFKFSSESPFSSAPSFENPSSQPSSGFGFFDRSAGGNKLDFGMGARRNASTPLFGGSAAPAPPTFGSPFGMTQAPQEKPAAAAPFVFGESNNTASSSSTSSAAAPPVFTFGAAAKTEPAKPSFSSGFGSGNGTFGGSGSSIFGNFSQPKASSFGSTTFGSPAAGTGATTPFGQGSNPVTFGVTTPKFDFSSSSSQQPQPGQPFQFRAVTPQDAFGETPPRETKRRVVKAVRRTQQRERKDQTTGPEAEEG